MTKIRRGRASRPSVKGYVTTNAPKTRLSRRRLEVIIIFIDLTTLERALTCTIKGPHLSA